MFPTSGYFRGVTCPYFVNGLCERPYCHFRHVKPPEEKAADLSTQRSLNSTEDGGGSLSQRRPTLLNMVGEAIKQVQRDIEKDKARGYTPQSLKPTDQTKALPVYKPSPIVRKSEAPPSLPVSKYSYQPTKQIPQQQLFGKRITIPEYKPTPIKVLQKQQQKYSPQKKNVYSMKNVNSNVSQMEYDPTENFSTKKLVAKKQTPTADYKPTKKEKAVTSVGAEIEAKFSDEETESGDQENKDINRLLEEKETEAGLTSSDLSVTDCLNKSNENVQLDTSVKIKIEKDSSDEAGKTKAQEEDNKNIFDLIDKGIDKLKGKLDVVKIKEEILDDEEKGKISHKEINEDCQIIVKNDTHSERHKSGEKKSDSDHKHSKSKDEHRKSDHKKHDKHEHRSKDRHRSKHKSENSTSNSSSKSGHKKEKEREKDGKRVASRKDSSSSSSSSKKSDRHHRHSSSHKSSHRHSSSSQSSQSKHSPHDSRKRHSSSKHDDKHRSSSRKSKDKSSSRSKSSSSQRQSESDEKKKQEAKRSISHQDLFGSDDSDNDDVIILSDNPPEDSSQKGVGSDDEIQLSSASSSDSEDKEIDLAELAMDVDMDEHDTYQECLKIFQEETPKVKPKPFTVDISSDSGDEPVVLSKRKRMAHEGADEGAVKRAKVEPPKYRPSPAQVMYNRMRDMQKKAEEAATKRAEEEAKKKLDEKEIKKQMKAAAMQRQLEEEVRKHQEKASGKIVKKEHGGRLSFSAASTSASSLLGNLPEKSATTQVSMKQRVAHSPKSSPSTTAGIKVLGRAGQQLLSRNKKLAEAAKDNTRCGTTSKTEKRVAHLPTQAVLKRPVIPTEYGSKVPTNIRQRYLNLFIDESLKIYPSQPDAFDRALSEEKGVYERSSSRTVYLNVAVNTVKKLRNEVSSVQASESPSTSPSGPKNPKVLSHQALLGGTKAATVSYTLNRCGKVPKVTNFQGADLYKKLYEYKLTEEQLVENGFPMPSDMGGMANIKIPEGRKKPISHKPTERICCRCGSRFAVAPSTGNIVNNEECHYHWGRCWKKKIAGSIESRYTCCEGDLSTKGCAVAIAHVHEQNKYENFSGYMKTIPGSPRHDGDYGVYALDCEMVYTLAGSELARITVIGPNLKPVYESLVKPDKKVLDHNTRFSGIKEEDLEGVSTTLRDVQAVLLSMCTDRTILMGHSLESDFVALKFIHGTVVDTSIVFPHKLGPPYKRALRNLTSEHLQKIIQNSESGHDSQEDAVACMELMIWKLKQEANKANRRS